MLSLEGKSAGEIRRIFQEQIAELDGIEKPTEVQQPTEIIVEHNHPMLGDMVKTPWVDGARPILEIQDGKAYYVQGVGHLHEPMFSKYYTWNASTNQWEMRK